RDPGRNPLFQICLVYQDTGSAPGPGADDGVPAAAVPTTPDTARFDLVLYLSPGRDGGVGVRLEYSSELFDADRMVRLLAHYERVVGPLVARPEERPSQVDLLDDAERQTLLADHNRTAI